MSQSGFWRGRQQGRGPVRGGGDGVAVGLQGDPQGPQQVRVVVDDQDRRSCASVRSGRDGQRMTAARRPATAARTGPGRGARHTGSPVDSGSRMIIVSPPPGVASAVSLPPMASVNPFATASPSPIPVACGASSSRWNGRNISRTLSAGIPRP